jgi:N-6 DNA methylase
MQLTEFLERLGYRESGNFLRRRRAAFEKAPDFGHIFRHARGNLGLQGVYTLRPPDETATASLVPVVYVCKASGEEEANRIHRLVWNQNVVPFMMVYTPDGVKLYSGFRHSRSENGQVDGVLQALCDFNRVDSLIEDFCADSIDSGRLWRARGKDVTPESRVDWKLLGNLRTLDRWLRGAGLKAETSHALIGKYVYLHYLRDRGILSPKKLDRWGIEESTIFGGGATMEGLCAVVSELDKWLNGSIFPLVFEGRNAPSREHLQCVAGVFGGDEVTPAGDRQLSLDFQAYNFAYIPIETLSNVYEQFLHAPDESGNPSHGRKVGAYYTPIPVVNLMLSELEERRPLEKSMRILDPSCGSGAFLVQCYRRLIEKEFPPGSKPKPGQLKSLLQKTIFGVDVESDACNVTELSLILTLLDYVDPPDLEGSGASRFKLPVLRDNNIFCHNFFKRPAVTHKPLQRKFDWIVGNPPWKQLNPKKLDTIDRPVWKWIKTNEKSRPVGSNQVARAFAWEVLDYVVDDGEVGLFLPAMSLFENPARGFRQAFFQQGKVNTVVNFSNLAEVLAPGRFRVPAAAFFYEPRDGDSQVPDEDEFVRTYSPLVANQEPTRRKRCESWSLVINAAEIRDIPAVQVVGGSGLPWKLAMWGSPLDQRLLDKLGRRFPSLGDLEREGTIEIAEGPALVDKHVADGPNKTVELDEVEGKKVLDTAQLARWRGVFAFPDTVLSENDKYFANVRRGFRGLSICRPPHVIVSAARNFAVYDERFLVVPPRQIGIASPDADKVFLKSLSLYLSSDFARYHQFLSSSQFGVKRDVATLNALRCIPVSFLEDDRHLTKAFVNLHGQLAKTRPDSVGTTTMDQSRSEQLCFTFDDPGDEASTLIRQLNDLVSKSLRLNDGERCLVDDFVHVRLALMDGKTGTPAVRLPNAAELRSYATRLKSELDAFIGSALPKRHQVGVVYDDLSGMIQVDLVKDAKSARKVHVAKADAPTSRELEKTRQRLREERAQWVYFDRNLRIYEGTRTYIFKPMQRFHWTESQAMIDACEIIAETLEGVGNEA